jgi:hypothetical protein
MKSNGQTITPDELADRYFANLELYFEKGFE